MTSICPGRNSSNPNRSFKTCAGSAKEVVRLENDLGKRYECNRLSPMKRKRRRVTVSGTVPVNENHAATDVFDPDFRHPGLCINRQLPIEVVKEAGVRHLNYQ